jgi:16S rRNA (uracil1498-N3)-methyltransferase
MSAGRFFVAPGILADHSRIVLPPEIASQVRSVLRLNAGDTITLLDGVGASFHIELTAVVRDQVVGHVVATEQPATEASVHLSLCVGLLKAAKFEWIVQKGTELGVTAFVPLLCARSVAEAVSPSKLERWRTIATEAAEQSERTRVPTISEPLRFVEGTGRAGRRLIAALPDDVGAELTMHPTTIRAALSTNEHASVSLFIGPEGGFSLEEMQFARKAGLQSVTLGPRTLRAETAAIVAATLALDALGELG